MNLGAAIDGRIEAKMADLQATLGQLKQAVADFGTDLQAVTQAVTDLRTKQTSGQQVSDADLSNLQAEAQALASGHQSIQQLLNQAPTTPTAPTGPATPGTPTDGGATPGAVAQPAVGAGAGPNPPATVGGHQTQTNQSGQPSAPPVTGPGPRPRP